MATCSGNKIDGLPQDFNGCHISYADKIATEPQCACVNEKHHSLSKSEGKTTGDDFLQRMSVKKKTLGICNA